VNVLDENILEGQRQLLRSWRVSVRQIGHEIGRKGLQDEEIIPLLLTFRRPTLFTRDLGFYSRQLCHGRYALVILAVGQYEAAHFIRRVLRAPEFDAQAKRMGAVIRATHSGLTVWRVHAEHETRHPWSDEK
jgi:hypothetical protein